MIFNFVGRYLIPKGFKNIFEYVPTYFPILHIIIGFLTIRLITCYDATLNNIIIIKLSHTHSFTNMESTRRHTAHSMVGVFAARSINVINDCTRL